MYWALELVLICRLGCYRISENVAFQVKRQDTRKTLNERQDSRRTLKERQDTRRTLYEEPGPSTKKSPTPPLPPIKSETPRPETKQDKLPARGTPRKETPVLPPIGRRDSRSSDRVDEQRNSPASKRGSVVSRRDSSRTSVVSDDGITEVKPPKDTREFDPNIGVGTEDTPLPPLPPAFNEPTTQSPEPVVNEIHETQEKSVQEKPPEKTREKKPETPKPKTPPPEIKETPSPKPKVPPPEIVRTKSPETTTQILPVVAAAAANTARPRTKSRSRSRSRKRSRSRTRSHRRSRSRSRRKSSSRSRSHSRKRSRHRKSRSRKRYSSDSSSSSSTSPRRRRRHSYSPRRRRHKSRGRSKSRRSSSFDYDFERAKSIVRSLSRMRSLSRPRYRSPEYSFIGGGPPGYWPQPRSYSPRRKKKIIIVQNGMPETKKKRHSKLTSDSDSDISIVVKDAIPKNHKSTKRSESDSSESRSGSREKKEKSKNVTILKDKRPKGKAKQKNNKKTKQKNKGSESDDDEGKTQKNIRFDLKNVKNRNFSKAKAVEEKVVSTPEPDSDTGTPHQEIPKIEAAVQAMPPQASDPVQEQRDDVQASIKNVQKPSTPVSASSPVSVKSLNSLRNSPAPMKHTTSSNSPRRYSNRNNKSPMPIDDNELLAALEQLDKRADFELEQLKGGNLRKLPPDVNLEMKKKIFSPEFQRSIDTFLES